MYNLEYDRVNELFAECAYPIGEKPKGPDIIVDSISGVQFIYRKKFQKHLPEIGKMIDDLPDEFFDLSGPFSLLATRRDDVDRRANGHGEVPDLGYGRWSGEVHTSALGMEIPTESTPLHPLRPL